jgi:transcriptional regulator GlxA family with amidase domain
MVNVKIQITTQQMIQVVGSQKPPQAFKEMMSWVESHLTEPLTLKEIAASVHLSPRECQRIFKAYLHRTPTEYLQWRRILAAADNLRNTNEFCPCRFWEQMV